MGSCESGQLYSPEEVLILLGVLPKAERDPPGGLEPLDPLGPA